MRLIYICIFIYKFIFIICLTNNANASDFSRFTLESWWNFIKILNALTKWEKKYARLVISIRGKFMESTESWFECLILTNWLLPADTTRSVHCDIILFELLTILFVMIHETPNFAHSTLTHTMNISITQIIKMYRHSELAAWMLCVRCTVCSLLTHQNRCYEGKLYEANSNRAHSNYATLAASIAFFLWKCTFYGALINGVADTFN